VAGVFGDDAERFLERALRHRRADGLVPIDGETVERFLGAQQRHAAARHDAFFDGRARRRERILDAIVALLQLHFGGLAINQLINEFVIVSASTRRPSGRRFAGDAHAGLGSTRHRESDRVEKARMKANSCGQARDPRCVLSIPLEESGFRTRSEL